MTNSHHTDIQQLPGLSAKHSSRVTILAPKETHYADHMQVSLMRPTHGGGHSQTSLVLPTVAKPLYVLSIKLLQAFQQCCQQI